MQAVELHGGCSLFFRDAGFCCRWPQGRYTTVAAWFAGVPFSVLAVGVLLGDRSLLRRDAVFVAGSEVAVSTTGATARNSATTSWYDRPTRQSGTTGATTDRLSAAATDRDDNLARHAPQQPNISAAAKA